jgi:hypothetical protein
MLIARNLPYSSVDTISSFRIRGWRTLPKKGGHRKLPNSSSAVGGCPCVQRVSHTTTECRCRTLTFECAPGRSERCAAVVADRICQSSPLQRSHKMSASVRPGGTFARLPAPCDPRFNICFNACLVHQQSSVLRTSSQARTRSESTSRIGSQGRRWSSNWARRMLSISCSPLVPSGSTLERPAIW